MTIIEKIIANHSSQETVKPGDIVDVFIDARAARDFGGANVVENILNNGLSVHDASRTFFTFDCNPGGSDQKYAANQQFCRLFARQNDIKVYDIDAGVGTHLAIDKGLAYPGSTFVSTDSHANIMGAIGSFGQGMGDQDIAAAWANGSVWFKVPPSVKIILTGKRQDNLSAKDIVLNLLNIFGANKLLGYSVELYGAEVEKLTLDERIILDPVYAHEASYVGGGCPPIETEHGWLLIYHGVHETAKGRVYSACAALLDLNDPCKEIARLPYPLFAPEYNWELVGEVNNVVFPTGTALFGNTLFIYYGAADSLIACASVNLSDLVAELLKHPRNNAA